MEGLKKGVVLMHLLGIAGLSGNSPGLVPTALELPARHDAVES